MPILTRVPRDVADASSWFADQRFQIAGFGDDNDSDMRVVPSDHLHIGSARGKELPCLSEGGGDAQKACVRTTDASAWRTGDSGGPLYWTSPSGRRFLAGVLQTTGGRYTTTFYRGGGSVDGRALSNLGGWLEQFVSGRGRDAAFLSTSWPVEDATFTSNPTGLATTVRRRDTGAYVAVFEGAARGSCSSRPRARTRATARPSPWPAGGSSSAVSRPTAHPPTRVSRCCRTRAARTSRSSSRMLRRSAPSFPVRAAT